MELYRSLNERKLAYAIILANFGFLFIENEYLFEFCLKLYVFHTLTWVSAVLSLYTVLSSILHIEAYAVANRGSADNRVNYFLIFDVYLI